MDHPDALARGPTGSGSGRDAGIVVHVQDPGGRHHRTRDLMDSGRAGMPEPRSMNWAMPCPAMYRTARATNRRFARAMLGVFGTADRALSAAAWSAA